MSQQPFDANGVVPETEDLNSSEQARIAAANAAESEDSDTSSGESASSDSDTDNDTVHVSKSAKGAESPESNVRYRLVQKLLDLEVCVRVRRACRVSSQMGPLCAALSCVTACA